MTSVAVTFGILGFSFALVAFARVTSLENDLEKLRSEIQKMKRQTHPVKKGRNPS